MNRLLRLTLAAIFLFSLQQAWAQQPAAVSSKADATAELKFKPGRRAAPADSNKPDMLTPDQILAGQTLELAESQARGLDAPMRSYSLLQIAGAFTVSNPEKARGLLQDSFSASLAIH